MTYHIMYNINRSCFLIKAPATLLALTTDIPPYKERNNTRLYVYTLLLQ
jgi:hypothetical protein